MQFKTTFHRYQNGQSRFSTPHFFNADDFDAALVMANMTLRGLRGADPDSRYEVASIECLGLRGEQCDGALMFETREELSARVAEKG